MLRRAAYRSVRIALLAVALRPKIGRMQAQRLGDYRLHLGVWLAQSQPHGVPANSVLPAQTGQGVATGAELVFDPEGVDHGRIFWRIILHGDINKSN